MKIRMIAPGYVGQFTGTFGYVEFVNGESVSPVTEEQARFFASITSIECIEDGRDPGDNATYQLSLSAPAKSTYYPTRAERLAREKANAPATPEAAAPVENAHTRESLEAIADKLGIEGLRTIAEPMGIKATSIVKLIKGILSAQPRSTATSDQNQPKE